MLIILIFYMKLMYVLLLNINLIFQYIYIKVSLCESLIHIIFTCIFVAIEFNVKLIILLYGIACFDSVYLFTVNELDWHR